MKTLLITDGECEFCQLSATWLRKHFNGDWVNQPSQSLELERFGLTKAEVDKQLWFLIEDLNQHTGWRKYGGAMAITRFMLAQPKFYVKPFASILLLPGFKQLAQFFYLLIAKNRGKLLWIFKN
mgnify:CR=1 FL=1